MGIGEGMGMQMGKEMEMGIDMFMGVKLEVKNELGRKYVADERAMSWKGQERSLGRE